MAKFANVEIDKLKIHVRGDREITPEIADQVGRQIAGVLQPTRLIEGGDKDNGPAPIVEATPSVVTRRSRKRGGSKPAAPGTAGGKALNWKHDAGRWGTPVQTWKQSQKINWLLHVLEQEGVSKDLSPSEMTDVFESKFRDAGLLTRQNISRDLRNNSDLFGSVDGRWFLKQGGKDAALKLVAEAKGEKVSD